MGQVAEGYWAGSVQSHWVTRTVMRPDQSVKSWLDTVDTPLELAPKSPAAGEGSGDPSGVPLQPTPPSKGRTASAVRTEAARCMVLSLRSSRSGVERADEDSVAAAVPGFGSCRNKARRTRAAAYA